MFFEKLYNLIYHIGFTAGSGFMKFGKWLSRGLSRPVKTVGAVFFAVFLVIDKFILKTFKTVSAEFKLLMADIKRVSSGLNSLIHTDRKSAESKLRIYIKKAFSRHGIVFTFAVNLLVPIICLGVLCSTIGYWNKATLALEIKYNGSVIGYAKNESEYLDAEQQAKTRLKTAASASGKEQELIKPAQYQLKVVNKTDLTDSSSMCDKLIENSDSNITNACGIYINGDFLCAVKNETDATSVFDKILSDYKIDDPNAAKSFVENITYEQGLYPDNEATVWDAEKLSAKLKSKKSEAVYYTVKDGDTVSGIASANGLTVSELVQLNPGLSETIRSGDKLLVSSEVNYVRVQVTKTETHNEAIAYTSTNVNNANLYTGTKKVTTKGVNGVQQVTELVTYIDGTRDLLNSVHTSCFIERGFKSDSFGACKRGYTDRHKGADHRKWRLRRQGHYNRRQIRLAGNRSNVRFFGLRRSKTSRRYRYSKAGRRKHRSYNSSGGFGNRNHGNISSELGLLYCHKSRQRPFNALCAHPTRFV